MPDEWKGGTGECLIMGDLFRRGPNVRLKQWKEYCAMQSRSLDSAVGP